MADYHALQAVGDVYLDSIGWNGGTTTFNALAHNLPVVTLLRYFNVYGSRQSLCNPYSGLVAHFYARLCTKQPLLLYEKGTPGRDFVHVRDVVYANLLALTTPLPPALCLNIGSGQCHSLYELAATLIAVTGLNSPLQPTDYYRVGDIHTCYADLRCAQQWLGYHPQVDLCAGLQEFATWAKQQNGTLV